MTIITTEIIVISNEIITAKSVVILEDCSLATGPCQASPRAGRSDPELQRRGRGPTGGLRPIDQIRQGQRFDQQKIGPEHLTEDLSKPAAFLVRAILAFLVGAARQAGQGGDGPSISRINSLNGTSRGSLISA